MHDDRFDFRCHGHAKQIHTCEKYYRKKRDFQQRIGIVPKVLRPSQEPPNKIFLIVIAQSYIDGIHPSQNDNHCDNIYCATVRQQICAIVPAISRRKN